MRPTIKLPSLPQMLAAECAAPLPDVPVEGATEDSRRCRPGAVFVAVRGAQSDGHDHAGAAAAAGAVAVVGDRAGVATLSGLPYLRVEHPRRALGALSQALHGNPARTLETIGITGTNGKTSTALLTAHALGATLGRAAVLGTLGYVTGGQHSAARHTTPFGEDRAALFAAARDAGDRFAVMEVSSHALEQERVAGIPYKVGAFTNLTQDHLDYHESMDAYLQAKLRLFDRVDGDGAFTVVNGESPYARAFLDRSPVAGYTYGRGGDVRAESLRVDRQGTAFDLVTPWGRAPLAVAMVGAHSLSNVLCAAAICCGLGAKPEEVAAALGEAPPVPGRFERVDAGQDFMVVVDYAHTEDGLRNVLQTARGICTGRLICVFGCGGDRDRTKRPRMGAAAGELADFSVVTSDNPRTEDPQRIIDEVEEGLRAAVAGDTRRYTVVLDRRAAIHEAIRSAATGDVVVIAGKGHEDYQILGTERIHFDDREVAREALADLTARAR